MIDYIHAVMLWLVVFVPSSALASLLVKRGKTFAVTGMQGALLILSLVLIAFLQIPLSFRPLYLLQAVLLGFSLSLLLNWVEQLLTRRVEVPEFLPEGLPWRVLLLLILAPLAEETLNRGLVEGYLLSHGYLWSAIILSAVLFALPHWMAFEKTSLGERTFVTAGAFVMGVTVAYLFALSGSLLTAFTFHSSANFGGLLIAHLRIGQRS
ncbi:CPBP family intramembrane glutamic endopeptidase [Thermococcus sp.]|uniref:CPBP family intramembrane glutamic endopeptidase n=1 Tax=Thermococcus sp. TaxID=35749 RepID=UPI0025F84BEB|nr:CPBP family intramembrane glutamic endopeptidase [Thermococcus sp.]